jgi:hypothetical protein
MADNDRRQLVLPDSLISPSDLSKALRELENVDDFLRQTKARAPGSPVILPKTSQVLADIAETNQVSLLEPAGRQQLRDALNRLLDNPAKIHISFASAPTASFLREIVAWLRQNVHSSAMVETGLQPSIAAGCIIRTKNKVFDLSLRDKFRLNKEMLSKVLEQSNER